MPRSEGGICMHTISLQCGECSPCSRHGKPRSRTHAASAWRGCRAIRLEHTAAIRAFDAINRLWIRWNCCLLCPAASSAHLASFARASWRHAYHRVVVPCDLVRGQGIHSTCSSTYLDETNGHSAHYRPRAEWNSLPKARPSDNCVVESLEVHWGWPCTCSPLSASSS